MDEVFTKRCYIAINYNGVLDKEFLGKIEKDSETVEKFYPRFKQMKAVGQSYTLKHCKTSEDALFILDEYDIIKDWFNEYTDSLDDKDVKKCRNIRFIENNLPVARRFYKSLRDISVEDVNIVLNQDWAPYLINAAIFYMSMAGGDRTKQMRYVLSSSRWRFPFIKTMFEPTDEKNWTEHVGKMSLMVKLDREKSSLQMAFYKAYFQDTEMHLLLEHVLDNENYRYMMEFIYPYIEIQEVHDIFMNLVRVENPRWFLQCLLWAHRRGAVLGRFIEYCSEADFDQKCIELLLRRFRLMDGFSIGILLDLPAICITAWVYGRMDVFQIYVDLYSQGITPGWTVVMKALIERKKSFLQYLIDKKLDTDMLKWLQFFYGRYPDLADKVNLNEFTPQYLKKLSLIGADDFKAGGYKKLKSSGFVELLADRHLSPKELYVVMELLNHQWVHNEGRGIMQLFGRLLMLIRSDDAIIRIHQIINNCECHIIHDDNVEMISKLISQYDLPTWRKILFSIPVSYDLVLEALIVYDKTKDFLQEAKDEVQARFAVRHAGLCCSGGLSEGFKAFVDTDKDILALKDVLALQPEFYTSREALQFFLHGNATIAIKFWRGLNKKNEDTFRVILKAAISGKLRELRFYGNDLVKECSFLPSGQTMAEWMKDREISYKDALFGELKIYEDTSFSGIMQIGDVPVWSCVNYEDGSNRQCLLSLFDANKKVLYVSRRNGKIVGRALIRLTKMTERQDFMEERNLKFTDVSEMAMPIVADLSKPEDYKEEPLVFLERLYTAAQDKERAAIENAVVKFVENKADYAGVKAVVSNSYFGEGDIQKEIKSTYQRKRVGIYITKSRAGEQYLDSLGGRRSNNSTVKQEDMYVFTECYVKEAELYAAGNGVYSSNDRS